MKTYLEFLNESFSLSDINKDYPHVKTKLKDLTITNNVDNMNSIGSTFSDYKILDGIRLMPINNFDASFKKNFYSSSDRDRVDDLKERIKYNKKISPLISVIDEEGIKKPYVLEGGHRLVALYELGYKYLPSIIVLDLDSIDDVLLEKHNLKDERQIHKYVNIIGNKIVDKITEDIKLFDKKIRT